MSEGKHPATLNRWREKKRLRQQQLEFDVRRRAFRASPEFQKQLEAQFLVIERCFRWALPLLQALRPGRSPSLTRDGLEMLVSACGYGLTLKWHRPANTLRSACLFVSVWNRPVASFESAAGGARRLLEETFAYDLTDSGRAMFIATDGHGAYTSPELATVCLRYVIDRSRRGFFGWLRGRRRDDRLDPPPGADAGLGIASLAPPFSSVDLIGGGVDPTTGLPKRPFEGKV